MYHNCLSCQKNVQSWDFCWVHYVDSAKPTLIPQKPKLIPHKPMFISWLRISSRKKWVFPPLLAAQMGFWSRNFAGIKLGYGSLTRKQNTKLCWILVRSPPWPTYIRIGFELISWDLREKCSNRAWCYSKLELHKHVIKDCDKALELNPSTLEAYLYKGVASHL
jgi:hypothetical protein